MLNKFWKSKRHPIMWHHLNSTMWWDIALPRVVSTGLIEWWIHRRMNEDGSILVSLQLTYFIVANNADEQMSSCQFVRLNVALDQSVPVHSIPAVRIDIKRSNNRTLIMRERETGNYFIFDDNNKHFNIKRKCQMLFINRIDVNLACDEVSISWIVCSRNSN